MPHFVDPELDAPRAQVLEALLEKCFNLRLAPC